jgi:uncharacterized membrane protein
MILWGALVGAVLGWALAEFEGYGLVLGLLVGSAAGWAGRRAVRSEIEAATRDLRAQVMTLSEERTAGPVAAVEVATVPRVVRVAESRTGAAAELPAFEVAASSAEPEERYMPEPPARPADAAGAAWGAVTGWFLGGNTIVRVGLVILFVGLSFLARYAAAAGLFPIELRLGLVAAVGVALLAVGFRTRVERPGFALALQGTGVAAIYLTIFAGARLFGLLPPVLAYGLMIAVCALACALALVQNAQVLAVASFAGGFAVPLLLGRGRGRHGGAVQLLHAAEPRGAVHRGAQVVARGEPGRVFRHLRRGGGLGRGALRARGLRGGAAVPGGVGADLRRGGRPVRAQHAGAARPCRRRDPAVRAGAGGIRAAGRDGRALGDGRGVVGGGVRSAVPAAGGGNAAAAGFEVLNGGALAIGVGFLTLAVPLAAGAGWTSAAWAVEGAGAVWVGARQRRWGPRAFGLALQAAAALVFVADFDGNISAVPLVNGAFLGAMLIAAAALATSWWLRRPSPEGETALARRYRRMEATLGAPVFLLGFAAWVSAWTIEANRALPGGGPVFDASMQRLLAMLAFVLGAWGAAVIGRRAQWAVATWPSLATLPVLVLAFVAGLFAGSHVLDLPDLAIWVMAIAVHMHLVHRNDLGGAEPRLIRATLAGGVLLGTAMLADCIWLGLDRAGAWDTSWPGVAFVGAGTAVLALLTVGARPGRAAARGWPIDRHPSAFLWNAAAPIAAIVLAGAGATALGASGRVDPVPFLPLFNPVDLTLAAAAATCSVAAGGVVAGYAGAGVAALRAAARWRRWPGWRS